MKKTMRISAMFAAAGMMCAAMPVQPASAQIWTFIGSEAETAFQDMIPLDDKGMLNFSGEEREYQVFMKYFTQYYDTEVTDPETGETSDERVYYDSCLVYTVAPIMNELFFVLRENVPDAEQKMLAIMDQYYPEISQTFVQRVPNEYASLTPEFYILNDGSSTGPHIYELWDLTEQSGSQERADSIMHDLAEAGLITEFYTWGQSAYCQNYNGWGEYLPDYFDREKVESWLAENRPGYTVTEYILESELPQGIIKTFTTYRITADHELSYAEQFTLAADIYEGTGIRPGIWSFEDIQEALGQNALAIAGDANLDCAIDVSDAVLTARYLAEDKTAKITDQGLQNADADGDGSVTTDDITAILKQIARIE